ncbi:MAG: hypothetical protein IT324_19145 [Anaerolineae bacterium]|nr:hypothetical protein [Anaerolineae bacterium]
MPAIVAAIVACAALSLLEIGAAERIKLKASKAVRTNKWRFIINNPLGNTKAMNYRPKSIDDVKAKAARAYGMSYPPLGMPSVVKTQAVFFDGGNNKL